MSGQSIKERNAMFIEGALIALEVGYNAAKDGMTLSQAQALLLATYNDVMVVKKD